MNSKGAHRLGTKLKLEHPEWSKYSAEEVAEVVGDLQEVLALTPQPKAVPHFTDPAQYAEYLLKETLRFQLQTLPLRLFAQFDVERSTAEAIVAQNELIAAQSYQAAELGVEQQTLNEIRKAERASLLSLREAQERERIRLDAYKEEAEFDISEAIGFEMLPVKKYLYIVRLIAQMKKEKATKVEIAALEELRVQMARHLLKTDDGENLEATDSPTDSPSGN